MFTSYFAFRASYNKVIKTNISTYITRFNLQGNIQTTLASTADPKKFFGGVKKIFSLFFILGISIENYGF
jgi:hypothetical protein